MSAIVEKISEELIGAMKAKDDVRVSTLRLLKSSFKNKEIELGRELTDGDIEAVIAKNAKQRRESIEVFEKADRADLADREKAELAILLVYLPKQMSEDDIGKVVDGVLAEFGSVSQSDTGRVIGVVMAKIAGKADGNLVSGIVRQKLAAT